MAYKKTFSAMPFIKKGKLTKEGEVPIFLKINVMGERKDLSANMSVKSEHWESGKGRIKNGVKDSTEKNQYIAYY